MLTAAYIEALLVDEGLADQVWDTWDAGQIGDFDAAWAWFALIRNHVSKLGIGGSHGRS